MKSNFQTFDNITFSDLWSTQEEFVNSYKEVGFPQTYEGGNYVTDEDLKLIWLLLLGRFADSTIKPYNTYLNISLNSFLLSSKLRINVPTQRTIINDKNDWYIDVQKPINKDDNNSLNLLLEYLSI